MAAASARYAARDRWTESPHSQLSRFILGACSPENIEPNLALNLEISDLVNSKKGSAPREAALAIVGYINHRNPNVALLALNLLDICVKNCGYPFHLQIGTKDFLNELVRRFPERPPGRPTRVQGKILEAIEEWRSTICETSRNKEDLGFIRDMHRLLSYKGYSFPEVRREDVAVLNPSDYLKSAEEMEEEEREVQSAKLQELIRRGTPEDLQEANRLMKVMAGYDTRSKTDYRAKVAEEVGKIQSKARLLEERLEGFRPEGEDKMEDDDVFTELASALRSAQPRIQKMCEEESEDHDAVARLLDINDSIHRTVQRYELMKRGNVEAARKITSGSISVTRTPGSQVTSANELLLIDLDTDSEKTSTATPAEGTDTTLETDLLGLRLGEEVGGSIALGFGANTNVPGPLLLSSMTSAQSAATIINRSSALLPLTPSTSAPISPTLLHHLGTQQDLAFAAFPSAASTDPSTALSSLCSTQTPVSPLAPTYDDDEEWSFSSALPPEAAAPCQPKECRGIANDTDLKIEYVAARASGFNSMRITFAFTNNTTRPIAQLHYQLAVTRGYELQLRPQSGRQLAPKQSRGIIQEVEVWYVSNRDRKVDSVKLRWKAAYSVGGEDKTETGDIPELKIG